MEKLVKKYSSREADGYVEERKFERCKNGHICVEMHYEISLIPFATDVEKRGFVVFEIQREAYNVYLWVLVDDKYPSEVHLFTIRELLLWISGEMDVSGAIPEELMNRALGVLENQNVVELLKAFHHFYENVNIEDKRSIKRSERSILKEIKRAKAENKGLFRW